MRYENFLNVFLILLSEIVITTKNMFFKGMRYGDIKTFLIKNVNMLFIGEIRIVTRKRSKLDLFVLYVF